MKVITTMKVFYAIVFCSAAFFALAFLSVERGWAWGAIAVGQSGNIAQDGFAFGGAINKPTENDAKTSAVETCKKFQGAPKMAALCAVISSFHGQCYSMAEDPQAGTPGAGWAVAADQATAASQALDACKQTAGANRVQFCVTRETFCDTHD